MIERIKKIALLLLVTYSMKGMQLQSSFSSDPLYELLMSELSYEAKSLLIESSPDYQVLLESSFGKQLLLQMIALNESKAVQILIDFGVDVNKGSLPHNPLHVAVQASSVEIVRCLLNAGADKDFLCYDPAVPGKITPLESAQLRGYKEVADVLLAAGANPEIGRLVPQGASRLSSYNQILPTLRENHAQQLRALVVRHTDQLAYAARTGDLSSVEEIVSAWNVNVESDGFTPLYLAAQHGHANVVALLLSKGADPEKPSQGSVPLIVASYLGHAPVVKLLVRRGAQTETSFGGSTSLFLAIEQGHIQVVKALLEAQANKEASCNGKTPLFRAAELGSVKFVELLLRAGACADSPCLGLTPEEVAMHCGHGHAVQMLKKYRVFDLVLKEKIDELAKIITPETINQAPYLLHVASATGNPAVVAMVLKAGALVNEELHGATPLCIATYNGHAAVVKCLLDAGANPEIPYQGCTPLFMAEQKGYHEIVQLLNAAQVNGRRKLRALIEEQARNLLLASYCGLIDRVSTCVEPWNVNVTVDGITALYFASQQGHEEVVALLLSKGADPEKVCAANGKTPLFIACQMGHLGVVYRLLLHGVETETRCNGVSPMVIAAENNHYDIVQLLLDAQAATVEK